jgi:hypothetical protein
MTSAIIDALLDDDDEHNISRVYSSTAARLFLGGLRAVAIQPLHSLLRQHNLDCVGQPLPGSRAGQIPPHQTISHSRLSLDKLALDKINALHDSDDDEHNILRVYSSTTARLDLGSLRAVAIQPLYNLCAYTL